MNERVSSVLLFLSPCADLNALDVLESYDREDIKKELAQQEGENFSFL